MQNRKNKYIKPPDFESFITNFHHFRFIIFKFVFYTVQLSLCIIIFCLQSAHLSSPKGPVINFLKHVWWYICGTSPLAISSILCAPHLSTNILHENSKDIRHIGHSISVSSGMKSYFIKKYWYDFSSIESKSTDFEAIWVISNGFLAAGEVFSVLNDFYSVLLEFNLSGVSPNDIVDYYWNRMLSYSYSLSFWSTSRVLTGIIGCWPFLILFLWSCWSSILSTWL